MPIAVEDGQDGRFELLFSFTVCDVSDTLTLLSFMDAYSLLFLASTHATTTSSNDTFLSFFRSFIKL